MKNRAFTLIELLVVVLIIGILAAIAVPKYQEAVEKSIMQEAIVNLKAIAQAQDVFYLQNGRYATNLETDKLDISIPGEIKNNTQTGLSGNRIMTKYFIYAANTGAGLAKGVAHRIQEGITDYQNNAPYYLYIYPADNRLYCTYTKGNDIQKKLCDQIKRNGYL